MKTIPQFLPSFYPAPEGRAEGTEPLKHATAYARAAARTGTPPSGRGGLPRRMTTGMGDESDTFTHRGSRPTRVYSSP